MPTCAVTFQLDISGIQQYVLGSAASSLKAIRGASYLLRKCSEETWRGLLEQVPGSRCIIAGGGNFLGVVPIAADAITYASKARRALIDATAVATVRFAHVPYIDGNLAAASECLTQTLASVKAAAEPSTGGLPALSFCAQCEACGAVPAVEVVEDREKHQPVCLGCFRRLGAARRAKEDMPFAEKRPEDLSDLGNYSRPTNYLAFVYLDFDGMGEYFNAAGLKGESYFASSSTNFDRCVKAALTSAAANIPYGPETRSM